MGGTIYCIVNFVASEHLQHLHSHRLTGMAIDWPARKHFNIAAVIQRLERHSVNIFGIIWIWFEVSSIFTQWLAPGIHELISLVPIVVPTPPTLPLFLYSFHSCPWDRTIVRPFNRQPNIPRKVSFRLRPQIYPDLLLWCYQWLKIWHMVLYYLFVVHSVQTNTDTPY